MKTQTPVQGNFESKSLLFVLAFLAAFVSIPTNSSHAGELKNSRYTIRPSDYGQGGNRGNSAAFSIASAISETGAKSGSSGWATLRSGINAGLIQPARITDLRIVSSSSRTITLAWTAPVADQERSTGTISGYLVRYSSTGPIANDVNFATATVFTDVFVPASPGQLETRIAGSLLPGTTYFFALESVNSHGVRSDLSAQASTRTAFGTQPLSLVSATEDAPNRKVILTWSNPNPIPELALIVRGQGFQPAVPPSEGVSYNVGDLLGGATVVFSGAGNQFMEQGLALNVTWYYTLFAEGIAKQYSNGVNADANLNLRPLFVSGLSRQLSPDLAQVTIRWSAVIAEEDGLLFVDPNAPTSDELAGYRVYRSTDLFGTSTLIASVGPSVTEYTDALGGEQPFYHLTAIDAQNEEGESSLRKEAMSGDFLLASTEKLYEMRWPSDLEAYVNKGNPTAQNLHITAVSHPEEVEGKVLTSVEFKIRQGDEGQEIELQAFPDADTLISFFYDDSSGQANFGTQAAESVEDIGLFWNNGSKWIKVFGDVDTVAKSITIQTAFAGRYQVRVLARPNEVVFDKSQISNRFITPNNDGKNDSVTFTFGTNSLSAELSGKIFDMHFGFVADLVPGINTDTLKWDAKSNGSVVKSGVYMYRLEAEGQSWTGTVVVIR